MDKMPQLFGAQGLMSMGERGQERISQGGAITISQKAERTEAYVIGLRVREGK